MWSIQNGLLFERCTVSDCLNSKKSKQLSVYFVYVYNKYCNHLLNIKNVKQDTEANNGLQPHSSSR